MKLNIKYLDNNIVICSDKIFALEVENKRYFYRIVNDLYNIYKGNILEDIILLDDNNEEINYINKFKIFINFFDLNIDSKKYINDINKYIINNIDTKNKDLLLKEYKKIISIIKNTLNDIDISLNIDSELDIDNLIKLTKININIKEELMDNLFTLIDIESFFKTNSILVFINLKEYLNKDELLELYKYSIYNSVPLLLIDSHSYGVTLENENKLIIDENFDEIML